jgi:hypothetical protein
MYLEDDFRRHLASYQVLIDAASNTAVRMPSRPSMRFRRGDRSAEATLSAHRRGDARCRRLRIPVPGCNGADSEHKNAPALCRIDRQHVPCAAIGGSTQRLRAIRQRHHAKSQCGAPWPMKMGNIASPWRYEGPSRPANENAGLPTGCRRHYAESLKLMQRPVWARGGPVLSSAAAAAGRPARGSGRAISAPSPCSAPPCR